jgi:hypothetical protein
MDKKIFILYHEEIVNNIVEKHFILLTSMPAFFQNRHFCIENE